MNSHLNRLNRRGFLGTAGLLSTTSFFSPRSALGQAAPRFVVLESKVISRQPHLYHGWPTITRRRNGQLIVAYSGSREGHVCPFGRVEIIVSNDEGQTWSWPQVLLDSPIDDRDAGVVETSRSSILVTTFTSLAYQPMLEKAERAKPGEPSSWPSERLEAWRSAHRRLSEEQRQAELGQWMTRSTDGGINWSPRYSSIVNSPHGPTQLSDGRLLYAGKELWTGQRRVGVCVSSDDGLSWQWLAEIPARPGDEAKNYHELHAVEAADRRVVVQIRNHNKANPGETLQSESFDGGKSWSIPHPIGVWGLPSFLLRLGDGRLLMTYGHRRKPLGNQARVSRDHGQTWSEAMVISGDGTSTDLGYPSTVELADGSLLSLWYELLQGSQRAVLRQVKWRLQE